MLQAAFGANVEGVIADSFKTLQSSSLCCAGSKLDWLKKGTCICSRSSEQVCMSIGLYAGVQRLKQYQGVERRSSLKIEAILSGRQDLQDRVASELQYVLAVAEGQQVLMCTRA